MNMHEAIKTGELSNVVAAHGRDPNSVNELDSVGRGPLFTATLYRNQEALDFLLAHDATRDVFACAYLDRPTEAQDILEDDPSKVAEATVDGKTALHYAAQSGHVEVARVLIGQGADVDALDGDGNTPIRDACHTGPWKSKQADGVIELLLDAGAKIDLHIAAALGRTEFAKALLDSNKSVVDQLDQKGRTALFFAAKNNHLEMVKFLIDRGADVNLSDAVGIAALHRTSQQCSDELIQYLIDSGADAHLCCYVACGDVTGTQQALERHPDSVNEQFYEFNTVGYAIHSWQLATLRILLRHGCELSDSDKQHILRISGQDHSLLNELISLTI